MIVAMLSTKISLYLGTSPLPLPPAPPKIGAWAVLHEMRSEYAQIMVVLYLLINGPGKWSLDALLARLRATQASESSDELHCRDLFLEVRSCELVVRQRAGSEESRKSIRKKQPDECWGAVTSVGVAAPAQPEFRARPRHSTHEMAGHRRIRHASSTTHRLGSEDSL